MASRAVQPLHAMVVSLATDCSGMETPGMALKSLGVPVDHLFSCDVNASAKKTIMANFPPKTFYDDLTKRDNSKAAKADLYVAGFPCQPFSIAGKQQGFADELGRGTIFFKVREYIRAQSPKVFVLENVKGLLFLDGGKYFEAILKSLDGLGKYKIFHKVFDTKDHGVPQTRQRIYICGVRKDVDKGTFSWPEALPWVSIEKFLDPRTRRPTRSDLPPRTQSTAHRNVKIALQSLIKQGVDPFSEAYLVDCDSTTERFGWQKDRTPCITCGRANGHWITNRGRRLSKPEMMRLQGMEPEGFKVVVSQGQWGKQIGNAMSCNVLERILVRLLPAAGLHPAALLHDRWESAAGTAAPATPPVSRKRTASPPNSPVKLKRRLLQRVSSDLRPAKVARSG